MSKLCLPPALFEISFAGRCTTGGSADGGMTTSAGDTSVELEDLLVNPSVEVILVIMVPLEAHGRAQFVSASGHPDLWSGCRLLAHLGQPRGCGCRFYTRFSPSVGELPGPQ